jgi:hypothetical protein
VNIWPLDINKNNNKTDGHTPTSDLLRGIFTCNFNASRKFSLKNQESS